jgi:hypothetical protein
VGSFRCPESEKVSTGRYTGYVIRGDAYLGFTSVNSKWDGDVALCSCKQLSSGNEVDVAKDGNERGEASIDGFRTAGPRGAATHRSISSQTAVALGRSLGLLTQQRSARDQSSSDNSGADSLSGRSGRTSRNTTRSMKSE